MVALKVGPTSPIRGRLPHGWRIAACFNRETGIVGITSPDTDRFSLNVDTSKLDEYSPTHKPTLGVIEDACLQAKYENGVLRYDAAEVPEFWLEVHIKHFMKTYKVTSKSTSKRARRDREPTMMPWVKMANQGVLTVWPGTPVKESDLAGPEGVMAFFKNAFDIEITPVGCVETLPDTDADGVEIEGTGGRHDFFFYVKTADVPKFAIKRFQFGMRWWEDIYFNEGEGIYPIEFRRAYPKPKPKGAH